MQHRIYLAALLFALGLGVATSQSSSASAPTTMPDADTCASEPDAEAATFCFPRQCGPIPICTGDSVPSCTPESSCRWVCVPIHGPA